MDQESRSGTPESAVPVLIAGAGPTGLMLALVLTRLGIAVRIIDPAADAAPYSRALGVHARTLEFYRQLGFADRALDRGVVAGGLSLWVARRRVARVPMTRIGEGLTPFPFVLDLAQDAHERLLIEELATLGVTVERGTRLVHFHDDGNAVRATLARATGGEEQCEAAWLTGCDGAHSTVRDGLGLRFPGGTYTRLFYVADVVATGPAANGDINVDLENYDLLAVFAMKGEGRLRLVGTIRDDPARGDRELTFQDVSQHVIRQLGLQIATINWFSTYRVHHRVVDRFRVGRAFLLGDAAHIHSPVGAQGMNTGIGDAMNLGWKLAAVIRGEAPPSLLDGYEAERIAFARRLVRTTDRAFVVVSRTGPVTGFIRTRIVPVLIPLLLRIPAARRLMFRTVSQIGIHYANSALSEGTAGRVRGGDRLPWLSPRLLGAGGGDNFAPLASLAWQVHVYGAAPAALRGECASRGLSMVEFAWQPAMASAGLRRDAAYLVRPDGYVALADPAASRDTLLKWFASRGITGPFRAPPAPRRTPATGRPG